MQSDTIAHQLEKYGIIPVLAIESPGSVPGIARALAEGGLPVAEVTFRTEAAAEAMRAFRRESPDMLLGAGTVLTPENAELAKECGARFLVAPGLNPEVVEAANELGLLMVPGIQTPSELEQALALGCRILKVFPAELAGGIALIQALSGPYAHTGVRFVPTGGVSPGNLAKYLAQPTVLAVGGTWIAKKDDIQCARWGEVASRCRDAMAVVRGVRESKELKP